MYDRSGAALRLRKYMGVSLALWHSHKWATKKIMQVFGKDLIAPMFHHLFPDREYAPEKMKLPAQNNYLTFIRLAYPTFREQLNTSLSRRDLTTRQRHVLQNLSDLCEFFIPAVLVWLCGQCVVCHSGSSHTLSLSLFFSLYLSLSRSLSPSVCLCLPLFLTYCLCISLSLSLSLSLSFSVSLSLCRSHTPQFQRLFFLHPHRYRTTISS